MNKDKATVCF